MGRDKALLAYQEATLAEHVARAVRETVGSAALIGDPERYGQIGYTVYGDMERGCGPLGGIYTALTVSETDWNLIVACDMPGISARALAGLIEPEAITGHNCVMAVGPSGAPEPLCAVYHRRCLPALAGAIRDKRFKMRSLVPELLAEFRPLEASALYNVNTPGEWSEFEEQPR